MPHFLHSSLSKVILCILSAIIIIHFFDSPPICVEYMDSDDLYLFHVSHLNVTLAHEENKNVTACQFERVGLPPDKVCKTAQKNNHSVIVAVTSSPKNGLLRQAIRQTYGSVIPVLFFLGQCHTADTKIDSSSELCTGEQGSSVWRDTVFYDYDDTYRNLTLKTFSILDFILRCAPNTEKIVKVDDDTFINPFELYRVLSKTYHSPADSSDITNGRHRKWHSILQRASSYIVSSTDVNATTTFMTTQYSKRLKPLSLVSDAVILGHIQRLARPHRNKGEKYFVNWNEFPGTIYPPFASGPFYVMTYKAVKLLRDEALKICRESGRLPLHLEDAFFTGIVALKAGVHLLHMHGIDHGGQSRLPLTRSLLARHYVRKPHQMHLCWRTIENLRPSEIPSRTTNLQNQVS